MLKDFLYNDIVIDFKRLIYNGTYKPNTMLPSLRNSCNTYNVSLITMKRVFAILKDENYIYPIIGKGYFVSNFENYKFITEFQNSLEPFFRLKNGSQLSDEQSISIIRNIMKSRGD